MALHTTPGIPQYMHPVVALVTAGVEMDVLGLAYAEYSVAEREAVVHVHPRTAQFKEDIIQAFYDSIKHKPDTTFGNVKGFSGMVEGTGDEVTDLWKGDAVLGAAPLKAQGAFAEMLTQKKLAWSRTRLPYRLRMQPYCRQSAPPTNAI